MAINRHEPGGTTTDSTGDPSSGTLFRNAWWQTALNMFDNEARCSAYNNGTQSLANATWTAITLNGDDYPGVPSTMHSTSLNTSRITVPQYHGGIYILTAQVSFGVNATGLRGVQFYRNGSPFKGTVQTGGNSSSLTILHACIQAELLDDDYIEVYAYQSSGGALNAGSASNETACRLQLTKIR